MSTPCDNLCSVVSVGLASALSAGPTRFDIWFIRKLTKLLGRFPVFDLAIESAIRHNVLGGLWFAACLFVFWLEGARTSGQKVRQRVLTIFLGSTIAIALTVLSAEFVSWLPPARSTALAHLYPDYLSENINNTSFPSQSTALYSAVAAGIFSLNRIVGSALWAGVLVLVSLPRLYVGGHYPVDILVGILVGLLGYLFARWLEPSFALPLEKLLERSAWLRIAGEFVVFLWILETAVEFRDVVWIKNCLERVVR